MTVHETTVSTGVHRQRVATRRRVGARGGGAGRATRDVHARRRGGRVALGAARPPAGGRRGRRAGRGDPSAGPARHPVDPRAAAGRRGHGRERGGGGAAGGAGRPVPADAAAGTAAAARAGGDRQGERRPLRARAVVPRALRQRGPAAARQPAAGSRTRHERRSRALARSRGAVGRRDQPDDAVRRAGGRPHHLDAQRAGDLAGASRSRARASTASSRSCGWLSARTRGSSRRGQSRPPRTAATTAPRHGRQLPHHPRYMAYVRPQRSGCRWAAPGRARSTPTPPCWPTTTTIPTTRRRVHSRALLGAGASVLWRRARLRATASAFDLANAQPFDFTDWPLPGRSFFVTIAFDSAAVAPDDGFPSWTHP